MTTPEKSDAPEMTTIKGRGAVEAGGSVSALAGGEQKVKKVIVAVHGVGDQYNFATIQAVVNQFCRFHGEPRFSISPPFPEGTFDHLAFAEVYWAKVPREVVGDQHTIEESKKWALKEPEKVGPVWPLFLALAAFLYLWWLAALILDLVLVWHLLVHNPARVRRILARMAGELREAG